MSFGPASRVPTIFLLVLLLIDFPDPSYGFSLYRRQIRLLVERANDAPAPFIGLVMAFRTEAASLESSGEFVSRVDLPWIDLYGRRFHVGSIRGVPVIWVMSGERRLNAGITVQILLDNFNIGGIVHYGIAGSADDSLPLGHVSIPRFLAFTGSWTWTRFNPEDKDEEENLAELKIGAYNTPSKGENLLSNVDFKPEEFFSVGQEMKKIFWIETFPPWLQLARKLQGMEFDQWVNENYSLKSNPRVVVGLRASTADIFVDNEAYRQFLYRQFNVSTVDEESAAVIMTAASAGMPAIAIRGVSDLAGGKSTRVTSAMSSLASDNAFKAALIFIEMIGGDANIGGSAARGDWDPSC